MMGASQAVFRAAPPPPRPLARRLRNVVDSGMHSSAERYAAAEVPANSIWRDGQ